MNGFDLDRKPPVTTPSTSTPARRPDAPKPASGPDKLQAGPDQDAYKSDFSTLRMRAQDESIPSAATGQQAKPAQGAPGSSAVPVAAVAPSANADSWTETCDRFGHNRPEITPAHRKKLEALAASISARLALAPGSRARIRIDGHTDTSGAESHNAELGQKRADSAKATLELALRKYQLGAQQLAPILAESLGESSPVNATGDGVKDAGNRRVQITVTIEGPAPSSATKPSVQGDKKPAIDWKLPRDYDPTPPGPRRRDDDWWKRAEENQRKVDEFDRRNPSKPRSLNDVLVDGVTRALEPVISRLPKSLQGKARDGIRAGIEKGTEAGCDAAIDASGVSGDQAEAIKAACHAALKTKPGAAP